MNRSQFALVALCFLILATVAAAGPQEGPAKKRAEVSKCSDCAARTPILESGRPPLPGEAGAGVQSCTLINTLADWNDYCSDNVVPDCPLLYEAFFTEHTIVVVAIDTMTPRACEGSSDPAWELDCAMMSGAVRVVRKGPGEMCLCSAMPQQMQRLFLASAVAKTRARLCRVCEEDHTIDCLR